MPKLLENQTEFEGLGLYTLGFVLAMNNNSYNKMPDDLKAIIDANSVLEFSAFTGSTQADADGPARVVVDEMRNSIVTFDAATAASDWLSVIAPIYADWICSYGRQRPQGPSHHQRSARADFG